MLVDKNHAGIACGIFNSESSLVSSNPSSAWALPFFLFISSKGGGGGGGGGGGLAVDCVQQ